MQSFQDFDSSPTQGLPTPKIQPPQSMIPGTETPRPARRPMAKIAGALAKAQAKFVQPTKNKTVTVQPKQRQNGTWPEKYTFVYADYNAIVEAVRGPLSENGLSFTHLVERHEGRLELWTILMHEGSGEYLECLWPLDADGEAKDVGGDMTYGKRYSLSAITGCVADDDADADPKRTEQFGDRPRAPDPEPDVDMRRPGPAGGPKPKAGPIAAPGAAGGPLPAKPKPPRASAAQLKALYDLTGSKGWTTEQAALFMLAKFRIDDSALLDRDQCAEFYATVQSTDASTAIRQASIKAAVEGGQV